MNKPNIVLILVDDLGQRDLGCYGSEYYETPRIDALAAEGLCFSDAYAACPVCSPSRASLLTGKYPARVGITNFLSHTAEAVRGMLVDAPCASFLPPEDASVATALREGGYATWHVGKWHLGDEAHYPEHYGFDRNIGGCDCGMPPKHYFSPYGIPTLPDGPAGEYLTDRLTDEAIRLIREREVGRPFFLNLWHYAVHVPIDAPSRELVEKYRQKARDLGLDRMQTFAEGDFFPCRHKKDKRQVRRLVQSDPCYAAMLENLDDNVGRLVKALKDAGVYDNTILLFTSDNGGLATAEGSPTCNLPLAEGKGWMYEGGVRVPLIVHGPGMATGASDACVTSPDFYPTLLELAGLAPRPRQHVDGKSFAPALSGQSCPRGPIFWHYPHYGNQGGTPGCAVREGSYKLIYFFEKQSCRLYDLARDPGEEQDLAAALPQQAERLRNTLFSWLDEVEAKLPHANPDFVPWQQGCGSGKDVPLPFDPVRYDADVYYGPQQESHLQA